MLRIFTKLFSFNVCPITFYFRMFPILKNTQVSCCRMCKKKKNAVKYKDVCMYVS